MVSLNARNSQLNHLRAMPASLPTNNGIPEGPWSGVPLWRGLDSAFLCEPSIPKAPPTPRVRIEMIGHSLRISDENDEAPTLGDASADLAIARKSLKAPGKLLVLCALLGFLGGILIAWLFGVFG